MSKSSDIKKYYTARGYVRYEIEVSHEELNKYQLIKGNDIDVIQQKAKVKMAQWDEMCKRQDKAKVAEERTLEAKHENEALRKILDHTIDIDDSIDWEKLKKTSTYWMPRPVEPNYPDKPILNIPKEPIKTDTRYTPQLSIVDKLFKSQMQKKITEMDNKYLLDCDEWTSKKALLTDTYNADLSKWDKKVESLDKEYKSDLEEWEIANKKFEKERDYYNQVVDDKKNKYLEGDPKTITYYCEMVLTNSVYPEYFPKSFDVDYNPNNKILIVDYQFPNLSDIPTLIEVKYLKTKDEFNEKYLSTSQLNKIYEDILYQITIRTVHELFEADTANALSSIVFNGFVNSIDPATGNRSNSCILSLQTNKPEFLEINLSHIDPRPCFKKLKGVGSAKLSSLTPVAPILTLNKEDKRFTDSYDVADSIMEGENIAAMDWKDFEHLIRELFEKEFAKEGGEVKITRASRDGGIDAVVFDPDPMRGGKFVIQAKRYTNTVGVSAVRDLYGSVMNEGANKGILVTTADYGPDAYTFAKDKPLVLLNGGNLLHMLEKHGHKAKIDLREAKKILSELP